jgi:16S rRNA (guanine966-N2)-methyltransferase
VSPRGDAGRVIAGSARGQRLVAPGPGTRPLGDRVKQTLFAILEPDLPGARFLDLFAGSGAAGIEALSRGAAHATFVERDAAAAKVIHANLVRTHLDVRASVATGDAIAWLHRGGAGSAEPFDVAFVDPPYEKIALLEASLEAVGDRIRPGGRVVAKHHWRSVPPAQVGLLASDRERRFGETSLTFYRRPEDR